MKPDDHIRGGIAFRDKYGISRFSELGRMGQAKIRELGEEWRKKREAKRQQTLEDKYGPSYMQVLAEKMREARAKKHSEGKLPIDKPLDV